jgi:hypothetical protein
MPEKLGFDLSAMKRNSLCHAKGLLDWLCGLAWRIAASMRCKCCVIISSQSLSTSVRHPLGEERNFLKNFRLGIEPFWRYPKWHFDSGRNATRRIDKLIKGLDFPFNRILVTRRGVFSCGQVVGGKGSLVEAHSQSGRFDSLVC